MRAVRWTTSICLTALTLGLPVAVADAKATATSSASTGAPSAAALAGGREYGEGDPVSELTTPAATAQVVDGLAYAPESAPEAVKQVIWAGNRIIGMPYRYGGGHGSFTDTGYDCSGTISFALRGAGLVGRPRDSTGFFGFGQAGPGRWITIFTRASHAYMTVAGLRLDTSAANDPSGLRGPRWRPLRPSDAGFKVRHPTGL